MSFIQVLDTFFISAVVAYLITPFVRALAIRFNYLDHPRDNKVHARPTPLLGGLAIFIAFLIAVITKEKLILSSQTRAMFFGSFLLLVIGLIDDRMGMMPKFKLLGQFLAAMVVIKSGLRISFTGNYYLGVILTYIWIIGITNAFNLLDNMNGLSAGIAAIAAAFFGVISYSNGDMTCSAVSFALVGSSLGFLKHNFPKANIFMGDAGSLVLGYLLASIALLGTWKSDVLTTSLAIPILILGYPIFDTTLVTVMRILDKRSIFQGGKDHSSHRLALLGLKKFGAVMVIYAICVALGAASLAITKVYWKPGIAIFLTVFLAMLVFGVRLAMVGMSRFGRKKKISEDER